MTSLLEWLQLPMQSHASLSQTGSPIRTLPVRMLVAEGYCRCDLGQSTLGKNRRESSCEVSHNDVEDNLIFELIKLRKAE